METNTQRRTRKLIKLCESSGTKNIAERSGLSVLYLDQIIKGVLLPVKKDGTRSERRLGDDAARKIEQAEGLGHGWFDQPEAENVVGNQKNRPDELVIPQFETGGSMGSGLQLRDQPGVIRDWTVNHEWVQKNVPSNSGTANLCIVTGFGSSMRPLFNPGDPLLVDRGVKKYEGDAIYFFRVGDEGFIKSLQSIPGEGLRAISANREHFDAWTIKPDMDFEVFGRVLKVWKSEEF